MTGRADRRHAAGGLAATLIADPFDAPGERDLTAHVDFHALAAAARAGGRARLRPGRRRAPGCNAMGIELRAAALAKARAGAGRRDRRRARAADRARPDGAAVQGDGLVAPGWPEPAGFCGMITYRDATIADAPALDALFRRQLHRDVRPSLRAEDLAAFSSGFSAGRHGEASSPIPTSPFALAEEDGGAGRLCQARPGLAAGRRPAGPRSSCASSTCWRPGTAPASRRR